MINDMRNKGAYLDAIAQGGVCVDIGGILGPGGQPYY